MELIRREEAIKIINEIRNRYMISIRNYANVIGLRDVADNMQKDAYEDIDKMIERVQTIESRPKGKWDNKGSYLEIDGTLDFLDLRCCSCGAMTTQKFIERLPNFCPWCGADMRETETWNTSRGNVEMPKGLFDKIYEDGEE